MERPLLGTEGVRQEIGHALFSSSASATDPQDNPGPPGPRISIDRLYNEININQSIQSDREYPRHLKRLFSHIQPYEALVFIPLSVAEMVLMKYIGKIAGSVYKALIDLDQAQIILVLRTVVFLYALNTVLLTLSEFLRGKCAVIWRERLTNRAHMAYFQENAFGNVPHVDNCDQRITSEIEKLCSTCSLVILKASGSPLKILFYGYLTSTYTGIVSVALVVVFFCCSIVLQKAVALPLANVLQQVEKAEGDFRAGHMRVKEQSTDISLQQDQSAEKTAVGKLLQHALRAQNSAIWKRSALVGVTKCIDYTGSILNYVLVSAAILLGHKGGGDGGERAEFVSNASFFTLTFIFSLTELADLSEYVSEMLALISRIYGLFDVIEEISGGSEHHRQQEPTQNGSGFIQELIPTDMGTIMLPPTPFHFSGSPHLTMEVSIVSICRGLLEDIREVFPSAPLSTIDRISCCMTLQPKQALDYESMDQSLHDYLAWEKAMVAELGDDWSDSIDPKTGKALRGTQGTLWSEVQAFHSILKYKIQQGDICPLVVHPVYGPHTYPVTFFTTALPEKCQAALQNIGSLSRREKMLISLHDETISHPSNEKLVLSKLNLCLHKGEHLVVSGPNGSGKTTVLRHICRTLLKDSAHTIGYVLLPQVPLMPPPGSALWQVISYPTNIKPENDTLAEIIRRVGLSSYVDSLPHGSQTTDNWAKCLSFGQQQRLCIARVLFHKPPVALLDESTSGIDRQSSLDLIKEIQRHSSTIVVMHDIEPAMYLFQWHLEIGMGQSPETNWSLSPIP